MGTAPEPEDRWEHWLVHLLWAVSVRTSMLGEAALADSPLTLAGLGLLENINARPGITISEIARRAPQTQQALSQIAARLDKLGFIERSLSDSGRGIALHLTPAGVSARAHAHQTAERFDAQLAGALGATRYQALIKLLGETRAIVDDLEPARRAAPSAPFQGAAT
jgi:DNA-binding MarR family transcriptional regulator